MNVGTVGQDIFDEKLPPQDSVEVKKTLSNYLME